jgi:hypothetical protein
LVIRRSEKAPAEAVFSINVNVILTGSKRMDPAQQEALMNVDTVRILIVDASDDSNVLLDAQAEAMEFKTGSVGYGVQVRDCKFSK